MRTLFFAEVIHGVEATCYDLGYHLMLCNTEVVTPSTPAKSLAYLQTLAEKQVDGLLIMSSHSSDQFFQALEKLSCPLVIWIHIPQLKMQMSLWTILNWVDTRRRNT